MESLRIELGSERLMICNVLSLVLDSDDDDDDVDMDLEDDDDKDDHDDDCVMDDSCG